ncbi:MAG TPA: GTPase Era [Candidatus Woesebacteria bacterium]|nr:GTPase Era [Candidatus Woesebacteria bacterium]HPJ16908.1 GTPase Era [Candidatus Woesebacteria bacterium]
MTEKIKFGRVVIMGRPNTGKSTLLNALMQQKVSITSHLPQTTRKVSRVVYKDSTGVIIFSDTPGVIGKVSDLVGKQINIEAPKESSLADIMIMVVDVSRPKNEEENKALGIIRKTKAKKILVYNKIDKVEDGIDHKPEYLYLEDEFDKAISISAIKEKHIKGLINLIWELLPEVDQKSVDEELKGFGNETKPLIGMDSKEFVSEIIREKAYLFLRDEIPYSIQVKVESIKSKGTMLVVKADILCREDRYKKIIIGREGQKIKEIGYNARKELELMSQKKVFLELEVKTDKHWMERFKENYDIN